MTRFALTIRVPMRETSLAGKTESRGAMPPLSESCSALSGQPSIEWKHEKEDMEV